MRIALITKDRHGALPVRQANRDAHLAYIAKTGVVEMAGPFLDGDSQNVRLIDCAGCPRHG